MTKAFAKRNLVAELEPHRDFTASGDPDTFAEELAEFIEIGSEWAAEGDGDVIGGIHKFEVAVLKTDQLTVCVAEFFGVDLAIPTFVYGTKDGYEWLAELNTVSDDKIAVYQVGPL